MALNEGVGFERFKVNPSTLPVTKKAVKVKKKGRKSKKDA